MIRLSPDTPEAHVNRALAAMALGRPPEAVGDLTRALERGGDAARPLLLRAEARAALGDAAGAGRDREDGLKAVPATVPGCARLPRAELEPTPHWKISSGHCSSTHARTPAAELGARPRPPFTARMRSARWPGAELFHPVALLANAACCCPSRRSCGGVRRRGVPVSVRCAGSVLLAGITPRRRGRCARPQQAELSRGARRHGLDLLDRDRDLDPVRNDPEFRRLVEAARRATQ
jgi:hypothetical protein